MEYYYLFHISYNICCCTSSNLNLTFEYVMHFQWVGVNVIGIVAFLVTLEYLLPDSVIAVYCTRLTSSYLVLLSLRKSPQTPSILCSNSLMRTKRPISWCLFTFLIVYSSVIAPACLWTTVVGFVMKWECDCLIGLTVVLKIHQLLKHYCNFCSRPIDVRSHHKAGLVTGLRNGTILLWEQRKSLSKQLAFKAGWCTSPIIRLAVALTTSLSPSHAPLCLCCKHLSH